jgi:hypothetical protein
VRDTDPRYCEDSPHATRGQDDQADSEHGELGECSRCGRSLMPHEVDDDASSLWEEVCRDCAFAMMARREEEDNL